MLISRWVGEMVGIVRVKSRLIKQWLYPHCVSSSSDYWFLAEGIQVRVSGVEQISFEPIME